MYSISSESRPVTPGDDLSATDPTRVWSRAETEALFKRIVGLTNGEGDTSVTIRLSWLYNLRWARNRPTTSVTSRSFQVIIRRILGDAIMQTETNKIDDASLKRVIEQAEQRRKQIPDIARNPVVLPAAQEYVKPPLWSDATFNVTAQMCSDVAREGVDPIREVKLVAAGSLETRVATWAIFNTKGLAAHALGTATFYSETVRNAEGTGSGWAGVMQTDWTKLNVGTLSARAFQKCVASANPHAVEPGRYTVILEPNAVARIMAFAVSALDLEYSEQGGNPYSGEEQGSTKIGEKVLDERITISTNPMDPDCPYIPFDGDGYPYRPVTWIEKGVLKALSYNSRYARAKMGTDMPLSNPWTFRMSGGQTSIEEMIATTERGILVTNFGPVEEVDFQSISVTTVTRDGLFLIEKGKVKFPVKNMRVYESPLFIGNTVEQLGKPVQTFGFTWSGNNRIDDLENVTAEALGRIPVVVPPMKVRDFNFVSLSDAV